MTSHYWLVTITNMVIIIIWTIFPRLTIIILYHIHVLDNILLFNRKSFYSLINCLVCIQAIEAQENCLIRVNSFYYFRVVSNTGLRSLCPLHPHQNSTLDLLEGLQGPLDPLIASGKDSKSVLVGPPAQHGLDMTRGL